VILKPHWFHILIALADRDLHGSAIVRAVLESTGGEVRLWPVKLYASLSQMVDAGLIEERTNIQVRSGESSRLRYYRLTRAGRAAASAEAERLAKLASTARSKLAVTRRNA
jgi:DNA-binding PadR family transcriptional regulator